MRKVAYATALGLFGAGIVHIAILLLLPSVSRSDAWSRLEVRSDLYSWIRLDASPPNAILSQPLDPFFQSAACRFNLADGPVRVRGTGSAPFWSVSVFDRAAHNLYSYNDRTSPNGELDFLVLTPAEMIEQRKGIPPDLLETVFIEASIEEGLAVVRAFVPDPTWAAETSRFLSSLSCEPQS